MAITKVTSGVLADDAVGVAGLSATGTASASTFLRGDNAWASAAAGFNQEVIYTTSSSAGGYSPASGVTKIVVEVLAGGGGGSHKTSDGPKVNGGGGAGYIRKTLTVVSTDTMTVTIGAAGTAGGANSAGGSGGDTTFASVSGTSFTTLTAGGGGGGSISNYTPGVAGTATGGDFNIPGNPGRTMNVGSSQGGNSPYGYGGSAGTNEATSLPVTGVGYGSGGGGAADAATAGAGAPGICIITEYK